jgi:hypothetical protein
MTFLASVLACLLCLGCTRTTTVTVRGDAPAVFRCEVAGDRVRHALGLMFRRSLAPDQGMLFVYDRPGPRSFWMKGTRVPLDIVFIAPDRRILNIEEADPCGSRPCPRYSSRGQAQFVLEISQGLSRKYGFREGSPLEFLIE